MDKIPFIDGTKTQEAYVTINGQNYNVTPAIWSGNTPLSAFNLNKMQDNIETAIDNIVDIIYPIGSIYISVNSANPSTLFGGTWEAFSTGRTLVGVDTADTDFNTVQKTGGEKTHVLTTNEMPSHTHTQNPHSHDDIQDNDNNRITYATGSTANYRVLNQTQQGNASGSWKMKTSNATATNQNTGGGQAHNNLQPYITVYMWRRTA